MLVIPELILLYTSLQLFKAISLSILSFGFEVWAPTKTEILMMERSQLKILRTILGVPSHVPSLGVHYLCGTIPISYLIAHRQLNFVRNVLALPDYAVSRDILIYRANQCPPPSQSLISSFSAHLDSFSLPSVLELVSDLPSKKVRCSDIEVCQCARSLAEATVAKLLVDKTKSRWVRFRSII